MRHGCAVNISGIVTHQHRIKIAYGSSAAVAWRHARQPLAAKIKAYA
jgi:hypothetical protein